MVERRLLREHGWTTLEPDDASLLEDACRRIWRSRRESPTYAASQTPDDTRVGSDQDLIHFQRLRDGTATAKPNHYIGSIRVGRYEYVIVPKIYDGDDEEDIYRYLRFQFGYAYNLRLPESPGAGTASVPEQQLFAEALFYSFASQTVAVLRTRSFMSYQEVRESISTVRGRIEFSTHLKENFRRARRDRFSCIYEVYQEDCLFLRILKYVAGLIRERSHVPQTILFLTEILARLEDVEHHRCSYADCLKVRFTRYQQVFTPVLQYCSLFLSFRMANGSGGPYGVDYYLLNANDLFERFVCGYLQEEAPDGWRVYPKRSGYLAREGAAEVFRYENDAILAASASGRRFIVDMKYKIVDLDDRKTNYGISQPDLYQMIAYSLKRGITEVLLVYPGRARDASRTRRLFVDDSHGNIATSITACRIPMDTTDRRAIWKSISEATGDGSVGDVVGYVHSAAEC